MYNNTIIIIELPVRATPNQESPSIYVEKRQNGRQNSQKALCVPFLPQWGRFGGGGGGGWDRSFQVVLQTDLLVHYFGITANLLHGVIGLIMII